jgi:hypothetical protein
LTAPPVAAAQCYLLITQRESWVAQPQLANPETCFEWDSCSGGVGLSGGGCYKWATGADASATPWIKLGFEPLPREERFADKSGPDGPPPQDLYDNFAFVETDDCPKEGCAYGSARFAEDTQLFRHTHARSQVVTTVPATECVRQTGPETSLSAPRRGFVLQTRGPFNYGDVVYLTEESEGIATIWRRGENIIDDKNELVVQWEDSPIDPREGYWVEIMRANGQRGWARNPKRLEESCPFEQR